MDDSESEPSHEASTIGAGGHPRRRITNSLVAVSSAAIVAIYAIGYERTRSAAESLEVAVARRPSRGTPSPPADVASSPAPPALKAPAPAPASDPSEAGPSPAPPTPAAPLPPAGAGATRVPVAAVPPAEAVSTSSTAATGQLPPEIVSTPIAEPTVSETAATEAVTTEPASVSGRFKDGSYAGWGRCRHGRIEATVVIEGGRIVSSEITQCLTRYSCSWIVGLPPQVVARQSADVDVVSGATESADAFYGAVTEALAKAR